MVLFCRPGAPAGPLTLDLSLYILFDLSLSRPLKGLKEWGGPGGAARSVHAYSGSSVKGFPTLQEAQRNWDDYNEVKSQGAGLILDPFTGSP